MVRRKPDSRRIQLRILHRTSLLRLGSSQRRLRSFYLTLRVLPAPVRESIGLAYLVARFSDTSSTGRIPTRKEAYWREPTSRRMACGLRRTEAISRASGRPFEKGSISTRTAFRSRTRLPLSKEELDLILISSRVAWVNFGRSSAPKNAWFCDARHCRYEGVRHPLWQRPPTREHPP